MEKIHTERVIGKVSPFKITCEAHSLQENWSVWKKAGSQQTYG